MNELQQIATGLRQLADLNEPAVLATVVRVEGSAYRRPGARMLVTPVGTRVGCVSGGCLERDVRLRGARLDIGQALLVTYDSTASEETQWTLALGCNGRVDILIERLSPQAARSLADAFDNGLAGDRPLRLATLLRAPDDFEIPIATRWFEDGDDPRLADAIPGLVLSLAEIHKTVNVSFPTPNGDIELLLEKIDPPQRLMIFGGGWDAVPLLNAAKQLGWHVTIIDARRQALNNPQFAAADERLAHTDDWLMTPSTAAIVMHHDYDADLAAVGQLMAGDAGYVGVLGPKARTERILADAGIAAARSLHAPVGLDIGAETPQEIALSIIAEIVAWRSGHGGGSLRDRHGAIHRTHVQDKSLEAALVGQAL